MRVLTQLLRLELQRPQAELVEQPRIRIFSGVRRRQQRVAEKIELAPAKKHSACISSLISVRPAESRTYDFGIRMRASAMVRTNSIVSIFSALPSGVPSIGDQHVDRHALGMLCQVCEGHQHVDAILALLAHADDAAASTP